MTFIFRFFDDGSTVLSWCVFLYGLYYKGLHARLRDRRHSIAGEQFFTAP